MKDSASAASAGAELVLRRFPWAVLVRRPLLPPPETLPDRWLQAAEEEEVELLPFRSPPREENGTGPTQAPAGKWSWGLRAGKGEDLAGKCARRATLAGAKDPRIALRFPGSPWRDRSAVRSGVRVRKQVANLAPQCVAGIPSGDPVPARAPRGGRGASWGVPGCAERPQRARRGAQSPSSASPRSAILLAPVAGR